MRALLAEAADALRNVGKKALVVQPTLSKPYPDDPRWTPWTRFLGPAADRAYNLGCEIRRKLKASESGIGQCQQPAGTGLCGLDFGHEGECKP